MLSPTKLKLLGLATVVLLGSGANATPLVLENDWIKAGVSDYATLGSNGTTPPGILYDPTGTKNYGVNDFLTPGAPHELFTLEYVRNGSSFVTTNNNAATVQGFTPTTLTQTSPIEALAEAPSSSDVGNTTIKHLYSLTTDGTKHQIAISTTISNTGTTPMTDVKLFRSLDPDPDLNAFASFDTENNVISSAQVCGTGLQSNQTICLLSNDSNYPDKVAGITPNWASGSAYFLSDSAGITSNTHDSSIGLLITIGDIAAGESKTVTYSYLLASTLVNATTPTISANCTPNVLTDSPGQTATCTLTSDVNIPVGGISVNLDLSSTGAAARYTSTCSSPITMAENTTTATCEIEASDNNTAADGSLDVDLKVIAGTGYNPSATNAQTKVTINNDDALLSIACTPNHLTDSTGQVSTCTITSDMAAPSSGLPFSLQMTSAGTASRYSSTCSGPLQIAAGAITASCTVTATDNTVAGDGDLTVTATVQAGTGYEVSPTNGSSDIMIVDDDASTPGGALPVISVACSPSTLTDSAGQTAVCTITADKAVPGSISVQSTINSQLKSTANRFTTTCGAPLTLTAGATTATCEVSAVANTVVGDGDVLVTLGLVADASYKLSSNASATVTIQDDDTNDPVNPNKNITPVPVLGVWGLLSMTLSLLAGCAFIRRNPHKL